MRFFEDIEPVDLGTFGSHTFSAEEIIAFAEKYDRQYFHLDAEAAKASHFGGLVASGWHTASMCMRLFVAFIQREMKVREAAGETVARLGPSPGFTNLKWLKPVYAGDTIGYSARITGKRPLASKPQWGMIFLDFEGRNQAGDLVYSYSAKSLLERRSQDLS